MMGPFRLPDTMVGNTEQSTTLRLSTPLTRMYDATDRQL